MTPEVARLAVTADLSIEVDGAPVRVTARGGDPLGTRRTRPDVLGIVRASGRGRAVETALAAALLAGGYAAVRRRRGPRGRQP
jgi:hypothetical protein